MASDDSFPAMHHVSTSTHKVRRESLMLHGQLFSSLGPPSPDNVPSGSGSHSHKKAVCPLPAFIVRLVWSFHAFTSIHLRAIT